MKIQLTIDLGLSPQTKRWTLRLGIPVLVLGVGAVAYAAGYPWSNGDTLQAADLNGLQLQITALQGGLVDAGGQSAALVPPGTIMAYGGAIDGNPTDVIDGGAPLHPPPPGWLLCNGDQFNGVRATYTPLYAAIGVNFGGNSGSQAFNIPDLRGEFLRGLDRGGIRDHDVATRVALNSGGNAGSNVGSVEGFATGMPLSGWGTSGAGTHSHNVTGYVFVGSSSAGNVFVLQNGTAYGVNATTTDTAPNHTHTVTGGDDETRPINVAVNYIIKL